ncbi:MAG: hypothetical protein O2798_10560 [Chloroflexi bacterium]|nr:hypothetical protein [Chloroflexota bacterium]MDA1241265.1 hypothetical protein [Chloroflexota bacterium]
MQQPDASDLFARIDPMIVLMDAHRLLFLAIHGIDDLDAAREADRGVTVTEVIARATERHRTFAAGLLRVAQAQGADVVLRPEVSSKIILSTSITERAEALNTAHAELGDAYASIDHARMDEPVDTGVSPDGTNTTVRQLVIEHAMEQGAEAYLIAAALGRSIG